MLDRIKNIARPFRKPFHTRDTQITSMPFTNPLALLGLLSVVPLIIIYLIRPKPKIIPFSSTIFLTEGEAERSAILSRLIKDPLFWIQLIVLVSISVAAAGPYTTTVGTPSSHLVVVLDVSASMENSFPQALNMIDPYLDQYDRVSIVLASSIPESALQSGSSAEARDVLSKVSPRAVVADISSAMTLADGILGSEGGNILVVSDFISWQGDDPSDTRKLLEADGKTSIVFANTREGGDNVAIVGGWDVPENGYVNHTAQVHNFGSARTVPITIRGPGGSSSRSVAMNQGGDYYFSFTAFPGVNYISLDLNDAISWDNKAYIYVPDQGQKKVLYLGDDTPALSALRSLPNVQVSRSGDYSSFDLVVIAKNASEDGELNRYIDNGGKAIYIAHSQNDSPDYLPVKITGSSAGPVNLWFRNPVFASNIHFDEIGIFSYLDSSARSGAVSMIEANGAPVLAYWRLGTGTAIYDGLEVNSDFYLRPEYPIFWYDMINWLTGVPDISESNRKTGEFIPLGETVNVDTPQGTITSSSLLLDEVGIYRFQDTALAANLYDQRESDLSGGASYPAGEFKTGSTGETIVEQDLSQWVIILAALAILSELAVIWWRREA